MWIELIYAMHMRHGKHQVSVTGMKKTPGSLSVVVFLSLVKQWHANWKAQIHFNYLKKS